MTSDGATDARGRTRVAVTGLGVKTPAGQKAAYDYLGATIEKFPSGEEMCRLMETSGFRNAQAQPLSGGIVTIYQGTR